MWLWMCFMPLLIGRSVMGQDAADPNNILFPSDFIALNNVVRPIDQSSNAAQMTFVEKNEPPCASQSSHESLCEDDADYNDDVKQRFENALEKVHISDKVYSSIFSKMMIDVLDPFKARIKDNDFLEESVCPSAERLIFPKRGMTQSNEWVFLLNQGSLRQGIKVEECLNTAQFSRYRASADLSCNLSGDNEGHSFCRQRYIFRNMIAMDSKGSNIVMESVLVPSCCVCRRRKAFVRLGNGKDPDANLNKTRETPLSASETPREHSDNSQPEHDSSHFGLNKVE